MGRLLCFLAALAIAAPAQAETGDSALAEIAVAQHILPAYDAFAAAAEALGAPARACDAEGLRAAYHAAFDAWMGAQHIALGPVEAESRRFSIAFWPDSKGFVSKALDRLIDAEDPVVDDPEAFARVSVAAHGLTALERLLYDENGERSFGEGYRCRFAQAVAADLARTAHAIRDGWTGEDGFATVLTSAGAPGNALYLTPEDAARDLFKSLDGGLQGLVDLRLGRPLGMFDRPRPRRAEAWRSTRSMRNVRLSLAALETYYRDVFAVALTEAERAKIDASFARARRLAERAPDAMHEAVAVPAQRLKVEALQTQLRLLQEMLRKTLAPALGVTIGFNSLDGD